MGKFEYLTCETETTADLSIPHSVNSFMKGKERREETARCSCENLFKKEKYKDKDIRAACFPVHALHPSDKPGAFDSSVCFFSPI